MGRATERDRSCATTIFCSAVCWVCPLAAQSGFDTSDEYDGSNLENGCMSSRIQQEISILIDRWDEIKYPSKLQAKPVYTLKVTTMISREDKELERLRQSPEVGSGTTSVSNLTSGDCRNLSDSSCWFELAEDLYFLR